MTEVVSGQIDEFTANQTGSQPKIVDGRFRLMILQALPKPEGGVLKQVVSVFKLPDRRDVAQNLASEESQAPH